MIPEAKELFSDFNFFNKLLSHLKFKYVTEKPTLESLIDLLKKSKKVNFDNFDESKFVFNYEDYNDSNNIFEFYFELKNKNENDYNAVNIDIVYNEEKQKYQVINIGYENNEKKLWIFIESDYMNSIISKEKHIRFHNEKEGGTIELYIIKQKEFKFYHSDAANEFSKKYITDIKNEKDAVNVIKRILRITPASLEQQELETLHNDFTLETCIFSSKLNKAETAFCMKNDNKSKPKNIKKK